MTNKLFCTFSNIESLDHNINHILTKNTVLYNNIFILSIEGNKELLITYNLDSINLNNNLILPNTILTHRKRESNTLYTINALNALIVKLNGHLDTKYPVKWSEYNNSIMLIQDSELNILKTKIYDIVKT